ncbi:hypothetical protein LXL04_030555 [Taraxacum kok-saghyz]
MKLSTHLLVYPFPTSGHIIPLLDLTDLLLRRGLTITVIISPANLPLLDPLLSSHPSSLHKLLFSDPEITPFPDPLIAKVLSTQKLFDPIVKWFRSHPSPPVAILSDFFLGWTTELASHLGIRRVVFSTSGVLSFSILQTLWEDVEEINADNGDQRDEKLSISFPEIPNSPEFPRWQLLPVSCNFKKGEPNYESFRNGMLGNMNSWGIVYNTFEDLESVYIDHMKKQMGHDRVWAVGPLLPNEHSLLSTMTRGGSGIVPPNDLLKWLDKKPDDSVVYICFGSQTTLTEKQMSALTCALELTNVNFILCAKGINSAFLDGFEDQVNGRGFVVKGWAPQLVILRHRAVGSFVSHCGWNSTLEGVAAGVMMLTWPMGADQYVDVKLLIDELGVAKRVCEGGPKSVPDSVELARLLDESLSGDIPERVKVKELSKAASEAVKKGTSIKNLDTFVKLLFEL